MIISYHHYDNVPCCVMSDPSTGVQKAEGYFAGQGMMPVSVTNVLWQGEVITERQFKQKVAALSIAGRKQAAQSD